MDLGLEFDSYIVSSPSLGEFRLLDVDHRVVLPVCKNVRGLVTGGDVIHCWALPSAGVKADGVPGRLNQVNFNIIRSGVFYGQCSEICGANHSFMPIVVERLSPGLFLSWCSLLCVGYICGCKLRFGYYCPQRIFFWFGSLLKTIKCKFLEAVFIAQIFICFCLRRWFSGCRYLVDLLSFIVIVFLLLYGLKERSGFAALKQIVTAVSSANSSTRAMNQYIGILIGSNSLITFFSKIFSPLIVLISVDGVTSTIITALIMITVIVIALDFFLGM